MRTSLLEKLELSRTKALAAAGVTGVVVGSFAVAWAATGPSPSTPTQLASSETAGDVSGPRDEAEHAGDPRCVGSTPTGGGTDDGGATTSTAPTVPTTDDVTSTTVAGPGGETPSADVRTFAAGDAGTVTYSVNGSTLSLIQAAPAAGWRVEVEQGSGSEIDLDFRSGTRRVQVDVEFEDGGVRERVRLRDDADDSRTEIVNGTTTEVRNGDDDGRDDDGDDDRSGHGGDDDHGDDDHDGDDDNSGHGSDDD